MSESSEWCLKNILKVTRIHLTLPFPRKILLFTPTTCPVVRSGKKREFTVSGLLNAFISKTDGALIPETISQLVIQPDVYIQSGNFESTSGISPVSRKQYSAMLYANESSEDNTLLTFKKSRHTAEITVESTDSITTAINRTLQDSTANIVEENTETDIMPCLHNSEHLTIFIHTRRLYKAHNSGKNTTDRSAPMTCTVTMTTAIENRLKVSMKTNMVGICYRRNYIIISEGQRQTVWYHRKCLKTREFLFTSDGNNVTMKVHVSDTLRSYFIKVSSTPVSARLELVRQSPTQGYVQTPGNNNWETYLELMDTWQQIFPPTDHVTLLSMSRLFVEKWRGKCVDVVEVYAGGRAKENRVWVVCGTLPPISEVLDTRKIHVHFKTDSMNQYEGFKLRYTFHSTLHSPFRGKDGLWNCSVPEWPRFRIHFLCNLNWECQGGEDEAGCPYAGHCGQDYLTLDNRCYNYVATKGFVTWEEVSLMCVDDGGQLASLNTPREWKVVTDFLKGRQTPKHVFIGMKTASTVLPTWYRYSFQWSDSSIAYYMSVHGLYGIFCGKVTLANPDRVDLHTRCSELTMSDFLCELPSREEETSHASGHPQNTAFAIRLISPSSPALTTHHVECPAGHVTHDFMACDKQSVCWWSQHRDDVNEVSGVPSRASCSAPMTSLPVMFSCTSGLQRVPYSLVCDHRHQCSDGSDEIFCVFPRCSTSTPLQCSTSAQCVGRDAFCDFTQHCVDRSDESNCDITYAVTCPERPLPAVMNFDPASLFTDCTLFRYDPVSPRHVNGSSATDCPHTHFLCPGGGYCLPMYLRCNGVVDCPGREDEADCEASVCPGLYRCRSSLICLHAQFMCDGLHQCPEQDDELYCHSPPCPHNCTCHGLAFTCTGAFLVESHHELRYLNAERSGMHVGQMTGNMMLIHLSLAHCGVQVLENVVLPNLRSLDLTGNLINSISILQLHAMTNLKDMILSGNPLRALYFADRNKTLTLNHLESIDLSRVSLQEIDLNDFVTFPNLRSLNITQSQVRALYRSSNRPLKNVRVLDLRENPLTKFEHDVLFNLDSLDAVFAETYKLCCSWVLPSVFNRKNCHAPLDHVASCYSLLASPVHRVLLTLCCLFALLGNIISIVLRVVVVRDNDFSTTEEFVTHTSAGDLLMGVSLAVVAVADRLYQGNYALEDTTWRNGVGCKAVGFLFLLSSLVSIAFMFLITLDRLLSLSSASRQSFTPASSSAACAFVWTGSLLVTVLSVSLSSELFGQTAVCFPLLGTQELFTHVSIATVTMTILVFSFLLTSFTAVGQTYINIVFFRHHATSTSITNTNNISNLHSSSPVTSVAMSDEVNTTKRVFSSCVLNVACWLPLCVLSVLAWRNSPLPDMLHVHVGMLAVPATSALRPALYSLGVRGERKRRQRTQRLLTHLTAQHRRRGQNAAVVCKGRQTS